MHAYGREAGGGIAYARRRPKETRLYQLVEESPGAFLTLLGKLITKEVDKKVEGEVINWPLPRPALDG